MAEISRLSDPVTAEDLPYLPDDDDRVELVRAEIVREPPRVDEWSGSPRPGP